jgi:glucose/arabinose dehydrogenase
MPKLSLDQARAYDALYGTGASWGQEAGRAMVLASPPSGYPVDAYATGIRNCVGMTIGHDGHTPWCVVNERDQRGDGVPNDYLTEVMPGGFYGWPWFYIGSHEDPIHRDERPDLRGHVAMPDALFPPHSAPLDLVFYSGDQFPAAYTGDIFVTMHGSCCRSEDIIGYKVVRMFMKDGHPTGTYEDFLTGFIVDSHHVWGRPVGITVAPDGALMVSDDGSGTIWRISYGDRQKRSISN